MALMLLVESAFLCENESIFVRAQRYEILIVEFLNILNQKLIRFLNKHNICHRLAHAFLELLKFFPFIEEGLREERSIFFQINLRIAVDCVTQVEDLEDSEK